ncbi:MAG: hypothetical protein D8M52_03325 [Chlorobi bacterium]|jgi:Exopolyphosphatase|nr:MAG: hypothetical protein F9K28_02605 [Bacteroidota bacterium]MBL1160733.1 hypothetical protein [Chlorobiota bacterium]MBW7853084.1 hypothetical protein [Candidatus Kapabacteria bacterium]MCC6331427.1 hypothetical protein [Ignavibacteria bacterium]MBV6463223.1 Exopolyphosphatase [Chlorobiota bacterium]
MIGAGIDIGTNTILMVIAEITRTGDVNLIADMHEIPRLGEGLNTSGGISKEAVNRATDVLASYRAVIQKVSRDVAPVQVMAVATAALRNASNSVKVRKHLENSLGYPIHVISGQQEAALTYVGTTAGMVGQITVIDIGGGSTELVSGRGGRIEWAATAPIGCVSLTEQFCSNHPVSVSDQTLLRNQVQQQLAEHYSNRPPLVGKLLAVAGTATSLACLYKELPVFNPQSVDGTEIALPDIYAIADKLLSLSLPELLLLPGIDPRRADVLPSGVVILAESMAYCNHSVVQISVKGLRYGALYAAVGLY